MDKERLNRMIAILDGLSNSELVEILNLYFKDKYHNFEIYHNDEKTINSLMKEKEPWEITNLVTASYGYYSTQEKWVTVDKIMDFYGEKIVKEILTSNNNPRTLSPNYARDMKHLVFSYYRGKASEPLKAALDAYLRDI